MKRIKQILHDGVSYCVAKTTPSERADGLNNYLVFFTTEYKYGEGCRSPEWDTGTLAEALEFINS